MALRYENSSPFCSKEPMYEASSGRGGEISVFSAEKYFSDALNETTEEKEAKDGVKVEVQDTKPDRGPPSISTEASWSSRRVLLPVKSRKQGKGNLHNFLAALGCNYCRDNKSVAVDENIRENKNYMKVDESVGRSWINESVMNKEDIASNLEKRLAMLTWDANPRVDRIRPRVVGSEQPGNDDIDSDSSSELFEIKSLSSRGHRVFRHQESSHTSQCVSPSNDWSSVAKFSVASFYDQRYKKPGPSMLLGCRSQGAVKVVGGAHELPDKKPDFRFKSATTPTSGFQEDIKEKGIHSAHALPSILQDLGQEKEEEEEKGRGC